MTWSLTKYTDHYAINPDAEKICILIPGWGVGSDIFEWLRPALAQNFIVYQADALQYSNMLTAAESAAQLQQAIEESILSEYPQQSCTLIGWSLGGNIALQLALDFPASVDTLTLLATSPAFVAREHWPLAMDTKTYAMFEQGIKKQASKTLKRFDLLQAKGDGKHKQLQHALLEYRKQQSLMDDDELAAGLALLADFDQASRLGELQMPVLWCLGEQDQLVNAAIAEPLQALLPHAHIHVLPQVSHLPFLTATDEVFSYLKEVMADKKIEKIHARKKIAASFSKAAKSYDAAADVQKIIAQHLLDFIPKTNELTVLDAGCGTGFWTQRLAEKAERVIGLDLAQGMLAFAQQHHAADNIYFCGGDLEHLPLADNSIDVVYSSLAVQWCDSLSVLLAEWHRVLKPGGQICLATLGPKTLYELRESFQAADDLPHVNQFIAADVLCEQINQSALSLLQLKNEKTVMRYDTMRDLMGDLKSIGAQTVLQQAQQKNLGLMGKARFKKANAAYEKYRDIAGFLPATYEVIYLHLVKK